MLNMQEKLQRRRESERKGTTKKIRYHYVEKLSKVRTGVAKTVHFVGLQTYVWKTIKTKKKPLPQFKQCFTLLFEKILS